MTCYEPCQAVGQNEVWLGFGFGILGLPGMDFGVRVGLGEHIEMMPLHSPGVPYFGVQMGGDNFQMEVQD